MSNEFRQVDLMIGDDIRRRRWTTQGRGRCSDVSRRHPHSHHASLVARQSERKIPVLKERNRQKNDVTDGDQFP
ncbi:hypothetical protein [Rhizobium sp. IBUN]|uniref:hypothetical protein n=1 Tax=Rhizobium sp. IBUN TaxID=1042326 RepID=UPI001FDAC97B|nr:hypothetical protein [Rhizobium sp. IBUN]